MLSKNMQNWAGEEGEGEWSGAGSVFVSFTKRDGFVDLDIY